MNPELWHEVEECFHGALECSPETRSAFLDKACQGQPDLRREVELLLAREERAGSFLENTAFQDLVAPFPLSNCEFGSYRIVSVLGAGGMGEVYRAHDSRLDRDVAIKALPVEFAHDPERLARLRREARTIASLNHPNIAAIYGLEQLGEAECLVLELVEGETVRGPLPLDKALDYAAQIADALYAAHQKSIIHRDLKPDNVKITPQGRVKVLDFGLAKPISDLEVGQEVSCPKDGERTLTLTRGGIGTPGYMSPEQVRGAGPGVAVDKRTDIWSFGCLLYELLTGKRAFPGETAEDRLLAVLEREPDWNALPADTPAGVRKLLRHCLQKDVAERLDNIGSVRPVLDASAHQKRGSRRVAALTIVAVLIAAQLLWLRNTRSTASPNQPVPLTAYFGDADYPDFSPDGNQVVFAWNGEGHQADHLFVKTIGSGIQRQLTKGNFEEVLPKWSPDGRW
ncbi:MAG: serine/threonine-protein kinase, partial [Candidatus Eremiobacteraeota bacterium]|nr:serine/threonine-protein kinase [Candidatus Eremiobacteraeota bacterium]